MRYPELFMQLESVRWDMGRDSFKNVQELNRYRKDLARPVASAALQAA